MDYSFSEVQDFESSNIEKISYDEYDNILYIMFKGNTVYQYLDVTPDEFNILSEAESKGKAFRPTVKGKIFKRII